MNTQNPTISLLLTASLTMLPSCIRQETGSDQQAAAPPITNRLDVPPEVVNNLGITFETATRGRLGLWRAVPGQLEVPENRRWLLRAPAHARLVAVAARWQTLERGAEVATLASPELQEGQRTVELAHRSLQQATIEVIAARARHAESGAHLAQAQAFEQASHERLDELLALNAEGNTLTAREIIDARRSVTEAGKARLDAAVARDDLATRVATRLLEADQARLSVAEKLGELALLTGLSVAELGQPADEDPTWRRLEALTVRAPAAGVIVETFASQGEILQAGAAIVELFDTRELRFRGHLPEGDLGTLAAGNRVRLDFPSRSLQPVETRLMAPLPVADAETRMIHVEAVVPNASGALVHGMSVMAQVLVAESRNEEVLIPYRCVVFDGLEAIVFKRDPGDPNVVIRTPVELGARSAGRVELLAGVLDGDAVVADGVQQLKQTGLGKAPDGVHIHADGTWHTDHK